MVPQSLDQGPDPHQTAGQSLPALKCDVLNVWLFGIYFLFFYVLLLKMNVHRYLLHANSVMKKPKNYREIEWYSEGLTTTD